MSDKHLTICILTKESIKDDSLASLFSSISSIDLKIKYIIQQASITEPHSISKIRSTVASHWYRKNKDTDNLLIFINSNQVFSYKDINRAIELSLIYNVICGVYPKEDGNISVKPITPFSFIEKNEGEIEYGSSGFMLITYTALDKIYNKLKESNEHELMLENNEKYVGTPFFNEIIKEGKWLDEDQSFCLRVREVGCSIYGFISPTIGQVIQKILYLDRDDFWKKYRS